MQDGYSQEQYKRRALQAMTMIDDGRYEEAIQHLHHQLEDIPGDPEFFDALRSSTATFKLIASSVPFPDGVKPNSPDPWQGYPEEREEIFSFIEDHGIGGVVLLSGDRHRADVWKIEREEGYDLYEFQNARLTNIHTHESMEGSLYSYNEKPHFGRLRFDTTKTDPTVTYDIINIEGTVVHSTTLARSELTAS